MHLSIAVRPDAVAHLHRLLPAVAPARPEADRSVIALIAHQAECFCLGVQCACSLYRKGATRSDRLRKLAEREGWSQSKLERSLKGVKTEKDWTGLQPEVREALATVAERWGPVSIFLFWAGGKGGRSDVREEREVEPDQLRLDPGAVVENRLLVVKTAEPSGELGRIRN